MKNNACKRVSTDREAIKLLSSRSQSSMDRESVEDVSTRQKVSRWIEKLLKSYRDKVQKSRWIEIALTFVETRRKKGLIEVNLSRICQEPVELEEKRFFKEEKHIKMNATSKLLKQGSNQHVKLSKASLNKKNVKHLDPKHTHTHTLNKSNQFYISKTS